jgi:hypothetical protein
MTPTTCIYCQGPVDIVAPPGPLCLGCWDARCADHDAHEALEGLIALAAESDGEQPQAVDTVIEWCWAHYYAMPRDIDDTTQLAIRAIRSVGLWPSAPDCPPDECARVNAWAALCSNAGCSCVGACWECDGQGGRRTGIDTEIECKHCDGTGIDYQPDHIVERAARIAGGKKPRTQKRRVPFSHPDDRCGGDDKDAA